MKGNGFFYFSLGSPAVFAYLEFTVKSENVPAPRPSAHWPTVLADPTLEGWTAPRFSVCEVGVDARVCMLSWGTLTLQEWGFCIN